jgi:hypothetical protein
MLEFEVSAREKESSRTIYRGTGRISFIRGAYYMYMSRER